MKNHSLCVAMLLLCSYANSQNTTPYLEFYGGAATNKVGAYGFGIGAEMAGAWDGFLIGTDVRLQSSSQPILMGLKMGYFHPFDCNASHSLLFTGGVYVAKRNNHTKYHVSELGLVASARYYVKRFFFVEPYWQYSEEKHMAGINIGITGWIDK